MKNEGLIANKAASEKYIFKAILFLALLLGLGFSPLTFGFDWGIIREAIYRFLNGEEIYLIIRDAGFYYPPWVPLIFSPIAILPQKWGWAFINTLSIFSLFFICRRFNISLVKAFIIFLSPPMLYNVLQGHIDLVLMLGYFAPIEFMPIVAISKPQLLFGFIFRFFREKPIVWIRAAGVSGIILLISFLFNGLWPLKIIEQSVIQFATPAPHAILMSVWPWQLVLAVGLICAGYQYKDDRFYIAASPFMFSYVSLGSYIGVLIMACTALKWWQCLLIVLTMWIIRILGG